MPGAQPSLVTRTSGTTGQVQQTQSLGIPPPPTQQNTLLKNNKVDLADSEHIDITKSVYNATYGNSNQTTQLPLVQGMMTGTNPAVYTQNQNAFSFGNAGSSLPTIT